MITYSGSTSLCAFLCSLQNVRSYETHQGLNTKVFFSKAECFIKGFGVLISLYKSYLFFGFLNEGHVVGNWGYLLDLRFRIFLMLTGTFQKWEFV